MSRSYINATTKSNLLLPPSREELLAREPDLLRFDQSIDFDQLRVVIETAISKYKEDNASVDNTMSHDHDDVILKPFTESSCPRSKYSRKNAGRPSYDPIIFFKIFGPMLFFVGFIKFHLSNLNLFKPQGLSIISSKAPRGIHNFQEEVLRVWYAITSSSNCFNQLNRALTFS